MSENNRKDRVRVLGIFVDTVNIDQAVAQTHRYLENQKMEYIVFANTPAALIGQEEEAFAAYVESAALVLPGDSNIENAIEAGTWLEEGRCYQAEYFRKLLTRLNKRKASMYIMVEKEDQLQKIEKIIREKYNRINADSVLWQPESSVDQMVNSINDMVPSLLFICGNHEKIWRFLEEHSCKINAGLCVCMEEVATDRRSAITEWLIASPFQKIVLWLKNAVSKAFHNLLFFKRMKESQLEEGEFGKQQKDDQE